MTGVQTCALPICFPVTIGLRIISSVNYLIELGVPEDRISVVKYRKPKQIFYDGDIVEGFPRIVEFWIESN